MQQQRLWASGLDSASPGAHLSQHNHHLHHHHHHQNQILFSDSSSSSRYYVNNNGDFYGDNNTNQPSFSSSSSSSSPRHPNLLHPHHQSGHPNITTTQQTGHYLHHLQPSSQILVHKHQSALQLSSHNNPHHNHNHHHQQQQQQQRLKQIASYVEQQVAAATANSVANLGLTRPLENPLVTIYHQPEPQAQLIESPPPSMGPIEPVYMKQVYAEPPCQLNYTTTTNYLQQQQLPVAVGPRPRVHSVSMSSTAHNHLGPPTNGATCSLRLSPAGFIARSGSSSSSFSSAPRAASADQQQQQQQHHYAVTSAQPGSCLHQAPLQQPYCATATSPSGSLGPATPNPVSPPQVVGDSAKVSQASSPTSYQQSTSPIQHSSGSHGTTTSVGGSAPAAAATANTMSPSDALNLGINLEQYISKRNERERSRVRNVNDAFDNLKGSLPLDIEKLTKRMSKVEILRTAIGYIRNLENVLGYKPSQQMAAAAAAPGRTTMDSESDNEQQQAPPTRVNSQDSIKSFGSSSLASGSGNGNGNEYNFTFFGAQPPGSSSSQPASPRATVITNHLTPAVSPAISSCGSMSPPLTTTTTTQAGGAASANTSAYLGRLQAVQVTNYGRYTQNSQPLENGSGGHPAPTGYFSATAQPYQQQQQQQQHEEGPFYYQDLMRLLEQHD